MLSNATSIAAGPGFAQRYARGQVDLYGETRDYVRRVLARVDQRQ